MKNTYKLERRTDGHVWVNIKPLMDDIQKNYDNLLEIDKSAFTKEDLDIFELKILGMHSIYQFLGALDFEHRLKEEALKQAAIDGINNQINDSIDLVTIHTIQ